MRRLFNFRPILFAATFLMLGVCLAVNVFFVGITLFLIVVGVMLVAALVALLFFSKRVGAIIAFLLAVCLLGVGLSALRIHNRKENAIIQREYAVSARVDGAKSVNHKQDVMVTLSDIILDGKKHDGKLLGYIKSENYQQLYVGDVVQFSAIVAMVEVDTLALSDEAYYSADIDNEVKVLASQPTVFENIAAHIKTTVLSNMK